MTPETWARANRELLAKIITELTFEEILAPTLAGPGELRLEVGTAGTLWCKARLRHLGHWRVDPASLQWIVDGEERPLPDVADFVALAAPTLGVDPSTTAGALCELANTLVADARQLTHGRPAAELVDLDPALVEGEMRGHPWIVANKGRLGFDADDLAIYAPEAQQPFRLMWLAAAAGRADVRTTPDLDHLTVVRDQVGDEAWTELRSRVMDAGLDPDDVAYVPVHPWQWCHRIVAHHAGELARGELVPLGQSRTRYRAQQSIRTLVDADHPERRYLKLPLSILNTSVFRGLPRTRTLAAPALTEWLTGLVAADPFLAESGLVLLGEVASVSVAHRAFEAVPDVPYQHTEMLGAIWRESIAGQLRPDERALTLAALLHRDPAGVPLLAPLIERSGLDVATWVDRLHQATLPPLVHVLYRFGVTFSPHAQNCLLVLQDNAPIRLAIKDFVDDAMISAEKLPELADLPAEVRRAFGDGLEAPLLVQWIQGGLLVCVHRYLSELLDDHFGFPEAAFWASARRTLRAYQERFADELSDRFMLFDLDAPAFVKLCLNRVRLFERGYADDAERPVASAVGWIDNPLALA
ncbi:MAG TPA: IucA/IucC family siderophore biosynthesis protein [Acidimicrobiales bacterium]|jgi:siderophore synthetase component